MDIKELGIFGVGRSYDRWGPIELFEEDNDDEEDDDYEEEINFPVASLFAFGFWYFVSFSSSIPSRLSILRLRWSFHLAGSSLDLSWSRNVNLSLLRFFFEEDRT